MKLPKYLISIILFICCLIIALTQINSPVQAETLTQKRQAPMGIFIDNLGDFNIPNGSFSASFWVWSVIEPGTRNPLDSMEFLNVVNLNTISNLSIPTPKGIWVQKKVSGTFRHHWDMRNFPYDTQRLKIIFEESVDDVNSFRYQADIANSSIDRDINLKTWKIKKFSMNASDKKYLSNFGNPTLPPGASNTYSRIEMIIELQRIDVTGFLKMISGVLASAGLCSVSFFLYGEDIHSVSPRFGLQGASLFVVILSLRSNSTDLGSMTDLTLIDCIHLAVIVYILVATATAIYTWWQLQTKGDSKALRQRGFKIALMSALSLVAYVTFLMVGAAIKA